jgi:peptidoglycan/xylan/chitin deacetylase (PgdA/CDA1 family)
MAAKSRAVRLVGSLGGYRLASRLTRRVPRVLLYHRFSETAQAGRVDRATLVRQLRELRGRFNVVPLVDIARRLRDGDPLPEDAVAITVDDGYRDFYEVAFPVLQELRLPATLFVVTDFLDGESWLWPDVADYVLRRTRRRRGEILEAIGLGDADSPDLDPAWAWSRIVEHAVRLPEARRRALLLALSEAGGVALARTPPEGYRALTWQQLREVAARGIDVGGHTCSHPNLARLEPERLIAEIGGCKRRIEEALGQPVECFCYPNGTRDDYTDGVKRVVAESGYVGATVAFSDHRPLADRFELRRFSAGAGMFQFRKAVYGVEYVGARIAARLRREP